MPLERRISRRALLGLGNERDDGAVDAPRPTDGTGHIFPLRSGLTLRRNVAAVGSETASLDERVLHLSDGSLSIAQIVARIASERSMPEAQALQETRDALERLRGRRLVFYATAGAASLRDRVVAPARRAEGDA